MLLVNLSFFNWVDYRLKRNGAIFTNLLRHTDLFEAGIYVCPPQIADGGLQKYTSAPQLKTVERFSDRDLPIEIVRPLYSLPHWRIPSLRAKWARSIHAELKRAIGGRAYCLWINCPGVLSNALARELASAAALTVFDSSDDFKARPEPSLAGYVDELAALSDHVLCVNQATAERIVHPRKIIFRNCTSWSSFQHRKNGFRLNPYFPKPPGQVYIGFLGGIHETRADEALLHRLFREFPNFKFLFVGFTDRASFLKRITSHSNTVFIPELPHTDLPEVIRAFDVAIVPHADNAMTRGNDLLKVLDYFACGVPVVSTRCSGVELYGKALLLANNHDEFVGHIRRLVDGIVRHDPAPGERIAQERTWELQVPRLGVEIGKWIQSGKVSPLLASARA